MNQSGIILFDGICNLCCGWVQFVLKHDKKEIIHFASLQSESGKQILNSFETFSGNTETVFYIKNNQLFCESDAVLEICKDLGGIWKSLLIIKLIPCKIRNFIYRFVAKNRYIVFGKRPTCLTPINEFQKRFI
jgi:predicted DCC family thiol-disulfide oxidoreductase YuxK